MFTVMSFDPGETTGFCYLAVVETTIYVKIFDEFRQWEKVGPYLKTFKPSDVVYEQYFNLKLGAPTASAETIGVIKYVTSELNLDLYGQIPSARKYVERRYHDKVQICTSHTYSAFCHAIAHINRVRNIWDFQLIVDLENAVFAEK